MKRVTGGIKVQSPTGDGNYVSLWGGNRPGEIKIALFENTNGEQRHPTSEQLTELYSFLKTMWEETSVDPEFAPKPPIVKKITTFLPHGFRSVEEDEPGYDINRYTCTAKKPLGKVWKEDRRYRWESNTGVVKVFSVKATLHREVEAEIIKTLDDPDVRQIEFRYKQPRNK